MQALVLEQVRAPLKLRDRSPLAPGPDEVVVRIKAAALNRRDYWITQGMYPGIEPPVVLGSDGAGVVTAGNGEASKAWLDQEVILNPGLHWGENLSVQSDPFTILGMPQDGTFAGEVTVGVSQLHPKPEHLNWQQAAALPLAGVTAYRALFSQGGLQPDDTVLITGIGGGVATCALQFAVAVGARVWVTSSSVDKIERAVELGATGGLNYQNAGWWKPLANSADAPRLIIDSAGGAGYRDLLNLVRPGGCIVNYGATAGPPEKLDLFKVFWKQLRLQGTTMGSPADFTAMLQLVTQHEIVPAVDRTFSLTEGNEALNLMKSSPQFGKYVFTIS